MATLSVVEVVVGHATQFARLGRQPSQHGARRCRRHKRTSRYFLFLLFCAGSLCRFHGAGCQFSHCNDDPHLETTLHNVSSCIVTAYFRMRSKHASSNCDNWMQNILSLQDCMVIFCEADMVETILRYRNKDYERRIVCTPPLQICIHCFLHRDRRLAVDGRICLVCGFWRSFLSGTLQAGTIKATIAQEIVVIVKLAVWQRDVVPADSIERESFCCCCFCCCCCCCCCCCNDRISRWK
jgi:hypothetical protein